MTEGNPFDVDGVWLKSAFHTHTARSDGELDPAAHVRHHEWMGFDVVAITDHWTLTHEPSTDHILVITGAELAADPYGDALADSEILAIGISDIPEDPGGDRAKWGPIDAYTYKTFPDLSAAAAVHRRPGWGVVHRASVLERDAAGHPDGGRGCARHRTVQLQRAT